MDKDGIEALREGRLNRMSRWEEINGAPQSYAKARKASALAGKWMLRRA